MGTVQSVVTAVAAVPAEPGILTTNTYFWRPAQSASSRRSNEERHQCAVADYLRSAGFDVTRAGDVVAGEKGDITVVFDYSESCSHVYKHLTVTRAGRRSNILALRKAVSTR